MTLWALSFQEFVPEHGPALAGVGDDLLYLLGLAVATTEWPPPNPVDHWDNSTVSFVAAARWMMLGAAPSQGEGWRLWSDAGDAVVSRVGDPHGSGAHGHAAGFEPHGYGWSDQSLATRVDAKDGRLSSRCRWERVAGVGRPDGTGARCEPEADPS